MDGFGVMIRIESSGCIWLIHWVEAVRAHEDAD